MSANGTYTTVDGRPAVRFERRLRHPVDAVWRAVTEPGELRHWFPAEVEVDLRVGGRMRFTFAPEVTDDGEVLELDPPHLFAFLWGVDVMRFELMQEGGGTRLTMLHVLSEEGEEAAAKTAAGWHLCLDGMERRLGGDSEAPQPGGVSPEWLERYEAYRADGMPSGAPVPGLDAPRT